MIINLCFHGIGTTSTEREPGEAQYWVTRRNFLEILDEVRDEPRVALSFDDGNRSDTEIALPALVERGMRANFFALAGRLGDPRSLAAEDLQELRAAGMSLGSHGWAHVPWRGLDATQAQRELVEARETLASASNGPITTAALPLGRYDRKLLSQLRDGGYDRVFTSDRFPARPAAWLQARYSVTASDTRASVSTIIKHRLSRDDVRGVIASVAKRLR